MSTFSRGALRFSSSVFQPNHKFSRSLFTNAAVKRTPIRTGVYATAFVLSTGLLAVYYLDARSALHRYFLTPLLRHAVDAETSHKIAVKVLKGGLGPRDPLPDDQRLECKVNINASNHVYPSEKYLSSCGTKSYRILLDWLLDLIRMGRPSTVSCTKHQTYDALL